MRKLTLFTVLILLSTLIFTANNSYAGDKEWATVGKILTGVVGGNIVYNIFTDDRPAYHRYSNYYSYGYCTPGTSFSYYSSEYVYPPRVYYRYPSYYSGYRGNRRQHRRHAHSRRYVSHYRR